MIGNICVTALPSAGYGKLAMRVSRQIGSIPVGGRIVR